MSVADFLESWKAPSCEAEVYSALEELRVSSPAELGLVLKTLDLPSYAQGMLISMLSEVMQFAAEDYRSFLREAYYHRKSSFAVSDGVVLAWWLEEYLNSNWTLESGLS